jgi:arylsulfatase A-like enzyme
VRVPTVVRWPAGKLKAGSRLAPFRQLSDVAPTLLEASGSVIPEEMEGRSFLQQMQGQEEPSGYDRVIGLESTWQAKYYLRNSRYKYILARQPDLLGNPDRELYDLAADPGEDHNLAVEEPQLAAAMETELEGWLADKLQALGKTKDPVKEEGAVAESIWAGHRS